MVVSAPRRALQCCMPASRSQESETTSEMDLPSTSTSIRTHRQARAGFVPGRPTRPESVQTGRRTRTPGTRPLLTGAGASDVTAAAAACTARELPVPRGRAPAGPRLPGARCRASTPRNQKRGGWLPGKPLPRPGGLIPGHWATRACCLRLPATQNTHQARTVPLAINA
jgi:hypothetical protein